MIQLIALPKTCKVKGMSTVYKCIGYGVANKLLCYILLNVQTSTTEAVRIGDVEVLTWQN